MEKYFEVSAFSIKCFLIIIFVQVLNSCKNTDNVPVLSLKNVNVSYVDSTGSRNGVYKDDISREKAKNIISFTLNNPTSKKLLFIFDQENIGPSIGVDTIFSGNIGFQIIDEKGKNKFFSFPLVTWDDTELKVDQWYFHMYRDSIKNSNYKKLGIKETDVRIVNDFIQNSVTLSPGDRKTFKFVLSLPNIRESIAAIGQTPLYYDKLNDNHKFQLFYHCNTAKIKKSLPKYLIEELEHNEVEIFNGKLESEIVPLKQIK